MGGILWNLLLFVFPFLPSSSSLPVDLFRTPNPNPGVEAN